MIGGGSGGMTKQVRKVKDGIAGGHGAARGAVFAAALFVAILGLYAQSAGHDFIYDDNKLILMQATPDSWSDLGQVFAEPHFTHLPYYRPIARLSLVIQKYYHGLQPGPYHLFNVILAAVIAVTIYGLLRRPAFELSPGLALLGAAAFAAHPATSSCVYAISGREALLSAWLIILALYAFLRRGGWWRLLALLAFAAALLCREQAAIIPMVFVLADLLALSEDAPGRDLRRWLRRYLPVAVIFGAYFVVRALVLEGESAMRLAVLDHPERPLLTLLYVLQTIFAPFAGLVYEPRVEVWLSIGRSAVALAAVIALAYLIRRRWAVQRAALLFWLGWFVLAFLPTGNLLQQESKFAERSVLLALPGVIGLLAAGVSSAWGRSTSRRRLALAGMAIAVACGVISWQRGKYFRSDEVFLRQWLHIDPRAPQAHTSLGFVLLKRGQPEQAIPHYRQALKGIPHHAETRYGLGYALLSVGQVDEAIEHYSHAVRVKPDMVTAHDHLGHALALTGRIEEALAHFRQALELQPDHLSSRNNLAWRLATRAGRTASEAEEAVRLAERTSALAGGENARYLNTLAAAYAAAGRYDEAVTTAQKALRLAVESSARELSDEIRSQLELYRQRKPYTQTEVEAESARP